jgi:hypothetical protein
MRLKNGLSLLIKDRCGGLYLAVYQPPPRPLALEGIIHII